jgi:hypothetical protein
MTIRIGKPEDYPSGIFFMWSHVVLKAFSYIYGLVCSVGDVCHNSQFSD